MLVLADELERRLPPHETAESVVISTSNRGLIVTTPSWTRVSAPDLQRRWEMEFGQPLLVYGN